MARAYYNEIDRDAAHVLRSLIADGLIAPGDVDDRSIKDVQPDDLAGYTQCHFFAGAGLWSVAARLAGWADARPLWTGSCPCQPFSAAGKGGGVDDPRHLWPDFFRLIRAARPPVILGEQVAGSPGYGWFDGVSADLAREDFASRVADIPACAVDAPHIRQRLYWCALAHSEGDDRRAGLRIGGAARDRLGQPAHRHCPACGGIGRIGPFFPGGVSTPCGNCAVADTNQSVGRVRDEQPSGKQPQHEPNAGTHVRAGSRHGVTLGDAIGSRLEGQRWHGDGRSGWAGQARPASSPDGRNGSAWAGADWIICHDGKARRTEPGLRLLVDGMAGRVPAWRLAGNSIAPTLASEVIAALMDVLPTWPELRVAA